MSICTGNSRDHCCYFKGVVCKYLEENTIPNRRWSCGLFRVYQDWDKVINSDKYKKFVQPLYDTVPELAGMNCRDWPESDDNCIMCMNEKIE